MVAAPRSYTTYGCRAAPYLVATKVTRGLSQLRAYGTPALSLALTTFMIQKTEKCGLRGQSLSPINLALVTLWIAEDRDESLHQGQMS
jgi:hypothetical protein